MAIPPRSDRQIQQDVIRALRASGWLRDAEIGVEVDRGIVTLTGTVDAMEKRVAAVWAAHGVAGVLDVADEVDVRLPESPARTDADLARAIRRVLEGLPSLADAQIRTTVTEGCVWLEGLVRDSVACAVAHEAVRRVPGVRRVIDALTVDFGSARTDTNVSARERRK